MSIYPELLPTLLFSANNANFRYWSTILFLAVGFFTPVFQAVDVVMCGFEETVFLAADGSREYFLFMNCDFDFK